MTNRKLISSIYLVLYREFKTVEVLVRNKNVSHCFEIYYLFRKFGFFIQLLVLYFDISSFDYEAAGLTVEQVTLTKVAHYVVFSLNHQRFC